MGTWVKICGCLLYSFDFTIDLKIFRIISWRKKKLYWVNGSTPSVLMQRSGTHCHSQSRLPAGTNPNQHRSPVTPPSIPLPAGAKPDIITAICQKALPLAIPSPSSASGAEESDGVVLPARKGSREKNLSHFSFYGPSRCREVENSPDKQTKTDSSVGWLKIPQLSPTRGKLLCIPFVLASESSKLIA